MICIVLCARCLFRCSPNLRKLVITVFHDNKVCTNPFFKFLESDGRMDFSLNQLQEVELQYFRGTRTEVELVKLLLAKSAALKVMHIQYSSKMVAAEQLKILKEVIQFKRASAEADLRSFQRR